MADMGIAADGDDEDEVLDDAAAPDDVNGFSSRADDTY
jgi:hypothetical protein